MGLSFGCKISGNIFGGNFPEKNPENILVLIKNLIGLLTFIVLLSLLVLTDLSMTVTAGCSTGNVAGLSERSSVIDLSLIHISEPTRPY